MIQDGEVRIGEDRSSGTNVPRMFDRIAHRYDLLNRLLSGKRDVKWRGLVAELLPAGDHLEVLDLATGTGDQLLSLYETGRVKSGIGIDLAEKMLDVGRHKFKRLGVDRSLLLSAGDAEQIPFEDNRFDSVTISFGIRNVSKVEVALGEMYRVLKPGGRALILEFSLPGNLFMRGTYLLYLRHILPLLGRVISGDSEAYRYLNRTIESFPYGDDFCRLMSAAGFDEVSFEPLTFGVASIYKGDKR